MENQDFTISLVVEKTPQDVFDAVTNVRGWWSEDIEGGTGKLGDEFNYQYQDVHRSKMKIIELVQNERIVWQVVDNYFSFTNDQTEWVGDQIIFEISEKEQQTQLVFTHQGLVPSYECYGACVNGWTHYIQHSLPDLIMTGKGQPNSSKRAFTIHEVASRFFELAKQELWFEIQDELFADDVKSIEPHDSPYLENVEGKTKVRQKGENWVSRIEAVHRTYTTEPVVGGNHFAVGREMDITVRDLGRIQMNELMVYQVKDGQIILEQFFY